MRILTGGRVECSILDREGFQFSTLEGYRWPAHSTTFSFARMVHQRYSISPGTRNHSDTLFLVAYPILNLYRNRIEISKFDSAAALLADARG